MPLFHLSLLCNNDPLWYEIRYCSCCCWTRFRGDAKCVERKRKGFHGKDKKKPTNSKNIAREIGIIRLNVFYTRTTKSFWFFCVRILTIIFHDKKKHKTSNTLWPRDDEYSNGSEIRLCEVRTTWLYIVCIILRRLLYFVLFGAHIPQSDFNYLLQYYYWNLKQCSRRI